MSVSSWVWIHTGVIKLRCYLRARLEIVDCDDEWKGVYFHIDVSGEGRKR